MNRPYVVRDIVFLVADKIEVDLFDTSVNLERPVGRCDYRLKETAPQLWRERRINCHFGTRSHRRRRQNLILRSLPMVQWFNLLNQPSAANFIIRLTKRVRHMGGLFDTKG